MCPTSGQGLRGLRGTAPGELQSGRRGPWARCRGAGGDCPRAEQGPARPQGLAWEVGSSCGPLGRSRRLSGPLSGGDPWEGAVVAAPPPARAPQQRQDCGCLSLGAQAWVPLGGGEVSLSGLVRHPGCRLKGPGGGPHVGSLGPSPLYQRPLCSGLSRLGRAPRVPGLPGPPSRPLMGLSHRQEPPPCRPGASWVVRSLMPKVWRNTRQTWDN